MFINRPKPVEHNFQNKFKKFKLNQIGTSLKISLELVKTGLQPVKTGLFQQKNCLKIWFF